jgi:hypothetical protein
MVVARLRLNPHPRLRRECGTRKFNGVRLGVVEGCATRQYRLIGPGTPNPRLFFLGRQIRQDPREE